MLTLGCKRCGQQIELDEDKIAKHAETCVVVVQLNSGNNILKLSPPKAVSTNSKDKQLEWIDKLCVFVCALYIAQSKSSSTKVHLMLA